MEKATDFFDKLPDLTLEEVIKAYLDCRRKKRRTRSSLRFEMSYEHNLIELHKALVDKSYQIRPSKAFIVRYPVQREVFAADFRDRVVHHLIIGNLLPLFEKEFSDQSYSCRVGKGTLYGIRSVYEMMKQCSNAYTSDCYVLRLDIHGFFFHIDKRILYKKLKDLIEKNYFKTNRSSLLFLVEKILQDNPAENCQFCCNKSEWTGLPKTKSLFYSGKTKGLPIGNLTSQIFANFYLNDFDHYVIGLDKNLFYGRYVDDIVIMHPDHNYLLQVKKMVGEYLKNELGLTLHPKKISLQHFAKGFAFIGAYIKPGRIYPGKRLRASFYSKIQSLNREWQNSHKKLDRPLIQKTLSSINSYFGMLKYFDAWRVKLKGWNMMDEKIRNTFKTDEEFSKIYLDKKMKRRIIDDARKMFTRPMVPAKRYRVASQQKKDSP